MLMMMRSYRHLPWRLPLLACLGPTLPYLLRAPRPLHDPTLTGTNWRGGPSYSALGRCLLGWEDLRPHWGDTVLLERSYAHPTTGQHSRPRRCYLLRPYTGVRPCHITSHASRLAPVPAPTQGPGGHLLPTSRGSFHLRTLYAIFQGRSTVRRLPVTCSQLHQSTMARATVL